MYRLHEAHVTGQTLLWDHPEVVYVGPDTVIRDSQVTIAVPAARLVITKTKFINCAIRVKRQLNNFRFHKAYFENCQFKGRFAGCDFGRRLESAHQRAVAAIYGEPDEPLFWPEAGIVNCDLSAARLDACRFMDCDLSTLRLPLWPCFTVRDPEQVREQALELPWPGQSRIIPETWRDDPPRTVAVTYDARTICKEDGATEPELRAVLAQLPGVIM